MFDEYEAPCVHGFFNRGNLSDPGVAECVDTAMAHLITFLEDNVILWHQNIELTLDKQATDEECSVKHKYFPKWVISELSLIFVQLE